MRQQTSTHPPIHPLSCTQGLIFVLDSADRERLDEAREELQRLLHEVRSDLRCSMLGDAGVVGGRLPWEDAPATTAVPQPRHMHSAFSLSTPPPPHPPTF